MQHKIGTKLRWLGDPIVLPNGIYTVYGHNEYGYNKIVNETGEAMLPGERGWECSTTYRNWELVKDVSQTLYVVGNKVYPNLNAAKSGQEILEVVVVAKHSPETTVVYHRKEI